MAVRKFRNKWWIDFRFGGKRYRKQSPENSRPGAGAYEFLLRQRLARGESIDHTNSDPARQDQLFEEFAWRWFEQYVVPNNKFSEQCAKRRILRQTLVPHFGKQQMGEITGHHIEQFKALQVRDGTSNKTIKNRLTVLSKCLACAYEWLALVGAPPKIKWPKCRPPQTDYLSPAECEAVLSKAQGVAREMVLITLRTGMRRGEVIGLQWTSIDWENRSVAIRHSRCDVRKVLDTPKSNRERHIPLDGEVYEMLRARKRAAGYVFLDGDGKPFNGSRLNRRLEQACTKAGLRAVGWHRLRHTFASHLAMRGTPLHIVQMLLGHSSITTTLRYSHVAPSSLRTAIELLSPKTILSADFGQPVGNQWMIEHRKQLLAEAA